MLWDLMPTNRSVQTKSLKIFSLPSLESRLDAVVEFYPLGIKELQGVVEKFIQELNKELKKKKITVTLSDTACKFIAEEAKKQDMGARPIKRYIQDNITNKLSDAILFGELKNGGIAQVELDKEKENLELFFVCLDDLIVAEEKEPALT